MSHIEIDGHRIAVLFSESEIAERIETIAKAIAEKRPERIRQYVGQRRHALRQKHLRPFQHDRQQDADGEDAK